MAYLLSSNCWHNNGRILAERAFEEASYRNQSCVCESPGRFQGTMEIEKVGDGLSAELLGQDGFIDNDEDNVDEGSKEEEVQASAQIDHDDTGPYQIVRAHQVHRAVQKGIRH